MIQIKLFAIIFVVVLVVGLSWGWYTTSKINGLENHNKELASSVTNIQTELSNVKKDLNGLSTYNATEKINRQEKNDRIVILQEQQKHTDAVRNAPIEAQATLNQGFFGLLEEMRK